MSHLPNFEDITLIIADENGKSYKRVVEAEEQQEAYFEYGLTPQDCLELEQFFRINYV